MTTVAIHTLLGKFGRGKSGILRKFELGSQFAFDARVNRGFLLFVPQFVLLQIFFVANQWIACFPIVEHLSRHVLGGIVLCVA